MITIFIIAIGELSYKERSLAILRDYFSQFKFIDLFILEDESEINVKKAHPPWLKLISHRYTKNDNFTLCWDLDLLPNSKNSHFDFDLLSDYYLNMCYDTSVVLGFPRFNSNFHFNSGLIGIPKSERVFVESIYEKYAPGEYPSYEQYYLNDEIKNQKKSINALPVEYNTLYHDGPLFKNSFFSHYTWQCNDSSERNLLIQKHYEKYFSQNNQN
jgi:hypothetical protein